jgi:hypothetical protein
MILAGYWRAFPISSIELADAGLFAEWRVRKNELNVVTIPIIEELENIDNLRIRQCSRCGTLFFAGRLQQSACPEPCAHILRTQRWRAGYRENYKLQRIKKAKAADEAAKTERDLPSSSRKRGK